MTAGVVQSVRVHVRKALLRAEIERRSRGVCELCCLQPVEVLYRLQVAKDGGDFAGGLAGVCAGCQGYLSGSSSFHAIPRWAYAVGPVLRRLREIPFEADPSPSPGLAEMAISAQEAFCGSAAAQFLHRRRIDLDVAAEYGAGYSATWPGREWPSGFLTFPATDPRGEVVSLYARALPLELNGRVPEEIKHLHLTGRDGLRGYVGAVNVRRPGVVLTRSVFDALVLRASGSPPPVALAHARELRWTWLAEAENIVFAFDVDEAGGYWPLAHAHGAALGQSVSQLRVPPPSRDIAQAWSQGRSAVVSALVSAVDGELRAVV